MTIDKLLQMAREFDHQTKRVVDLGDDLAITKDLVKDLQSSMSRTISVLKDQLPNISYPVVKEEDVKLIRNLAGNLALLCNMILNGKKYTEEDKAKAIGDDV
jgi:hypothetical protein